MKRGGHGTFGISCLYVPGLWQANAQSICISFLLHVGTTRPVSEVFKANAAFYDQITKSGPDQGTPGSFSVF